MREADRRRSNLAGLDCKVLIFKQYTKLCSLNLPLHWMFGSAYARALGCPFRGKYAHAREGDCLSRDRGMRLRLARGCGSNRGFLMVGSCPQAWE